MLGIKYITMEPNTYLRQSKDGRIVGKGAGLSFFYFSPASSIVAVPLGSMDIPFIFNQMSGNSVISSDGIENDFIEFNSGMTATISVAEKSGRVIV